MVLVFYKLNSAIERGTKPYMLGCKPCHWTSILKGSVANFAQEVVQGQLPLSVEGLSGQGVEQFGRSEALVSGLHHHLSFLDRIGKCIFPVPQVPVTQGEAS